MLSFFDGWRRKLGCVTLVMALLLSIAWGRSKTTMDELVRIGANSRDLIQSLDGTLSFIRRTPSTFDEPAMFSLFGDGYIWQSQPADNGFGFDEHGNRVSSELFIGCVDVRRWDVAGITVGSGRMVGRREMNEPAFDIQHWVCPYWSLILPLTALSAYLILWRRRKQEASEIRINGMNGDIRRED